MVFCGLLSSCSALNNGGAGGDTTALPPCTADDSIFGARSSSSSLPFDKWADTYHSTVSEVIDAHMQSLNNTGTMQLQCTAPDYASMLKPTQKLKDLAAQLGPWKDPKKLQALSESEIGPVLLEYLRVYECAMSERNAFKTVIVPDEQGGGDRVLIDAEKNREASIIQHESLLARPALEKTLQIVGAADRLRPLSLDIECLKRTSLDIRNILGLVSQVSACLPRVRDARGSLRDLP